MTPKDLREVLGLVGIDITEINNDVRLMLLKTPTNKAETRLQTHFLSDEIMNVWKKKAGLIV